MWRLAQREPIYLAVVHSVRSDADQKELMYDNTIEINESKNKTLTQRK